jgi:HK97 family phage portal protein
MKFPFRRSAEQKDAGWPLENPPVGDTSFLFPVGLDQAVGLPAVMAVIRLLSHAAGLVPLLVLRGDESDVRERARDTWQWKLMRRPGPPPMTRFHFKADLAAQFAGRGQVYVRKFQAGGPRRGEPGPRVTELLPSRADRITPKRRNGEIVFDDFSGEGMLKPVTRTTDEIIHIRSFSLDGGLEGMSPITAARLAVTAGLRRQEFETMHMTNGIFPGLGFKWPANVDKEQAQTWIEDIEQRHKSTRNAGRMIFVGGGAELVAIPISLEDAQFAEATKLTIAQVAGMYQIPLSFFVPDNRHLPSEEDWRFFLTFALGPIMTGITDAFSADESLFHPDGEELYVHADTDALLSLDPKTKALVHKSQIQSGERLVDELRAADGLGPLPPIPKDWQQEPGKVPQLTPVGGGANPIVSTDTTLDGGDA